jgi:hypothetical protein
MWLHLLNIVYGLERAGSQHSGTNKLYRMEQISFSSRVVEEKCALHQQKLGKMMSQHYHNHLCYKNTPT